MKTFWAIAGVVIVLGLVAMFWPDPARDRAAELAAARTVGGSSSVRGGAGGGGVGVAGAGGGAGTIRAPIEPVPAAFDPERSGAPLRGDIVSGDITSSVERVFEPIAVVAAEDAADGESVGGEPARGEAAGGEPVADAISEALRDGLGEASDVAEPTSAPVSPDATDEPGLPSADVSDAPNADDAPDSPGVADAAVGGAGAAGGVPPLDELLGGVAVAGDAPSASAATDGGAVDADGAPMPPLFANSVEVREDGSLLVDGRFEVTGAGTAESPYLMPWDVLFAAQRVFRPREGLEELPAWVEKAGDTTVEITGFVAFPFMAASADECLLMLNQWDGCCIGVPPTPYDAVEVRLVEPVDTRGGMLNHGTIRGTLRVDPYVMNGWLVGLYVLDDARFVDVERRGQMPAHEPR